MSLNNIKVNETQIVGVDVKPVPFSDNLIKSGGVLVQLYRSLLAMIYIKDVK